MKSALFLETKDEVMMFFQSKLVQIDKQTLNVSNTELEDELELVFNKLRGLPVISVSDKATFQEFMDRAYAKHIDTKGMVPYLHTSN